GPGGDGDGPGSNDPDDDPMRPDGVGDPETPNGVGWSTRIPKLSNQQWENTVQDLFRLDQPTGFAADFTQEPLDKGYVGQAAAALPVSGGAWPRYQTAAEKVAELVTSDDGRLARILPDAGSSGAEAQAVFVSSFGRRAFRRPLSSDEQAAYMGLFGQGADLV